MYSCLNKIIVRRATVHKNFIGTIILKSMIFSTSRQGVWLISKIVKPFLSVLPDLVMVRVRPTYTPVLGSYNHS